MPDFNSMKELNIGVLVLLALFNVLLLYGAVKEEKREHSFMKRYTYLLITNIVMLVAETGINIFDGSGKDTMLYFCLCVAYSAGSALIVIYTYCLTEFIRQYARVTFLLANIVGVICGVYEILVWTSPFTGYLFTIGKDGFYQYGSLSMISFFIDPVMMLVVIILTSRYRKSLKVRGVLYLISINILCIPTMLIFEVWYPVPEYVAITFYFGLIFIFFHEEVETQLLNKEKELNDMKINLMLSQIKPHFIYNTLATISQLCRKNPLLAEETTIRFSDYLRVNLHSMENRGLVHFSKELEHVQTYLWIEQLRFGEELEVTYHIEADQFLLPQLTVQPLVENCVKHGMMGSEDVCHIDISAKELEDCYKIVISDDGCGFDTEEIKCDDKRHVGLRSVEQRLELMINGSMQIKSKPSEGTVIIIKIPKE